MVAINVERLGLRYTLPRGLAGAAGHAASTVGGRVSDAGRGRQVVALDGVSFSLQSGDRLAIVGPNGAGKTTLLKVIYGIFEPTDGRVDVTGRIDALFNINLGFRREATGRRNILLRGLINGWSRREIERRIDDIVRFSELGDFIDMPFKTYSQGMAARLAFATATSFEPEILLMDEWIGAGDRDFQEKARQRMNDMVANAGIILLASHNVSLLKRTCNKVLALEKGTVKFFGPADDYFREG